MKYFIANLLKILIYSGGLIMTGCHEKKQIINLISSSNGKPSQNPLKASSIFNLDSLRGFRDLKLNSALTDFDLADFDVLKTENGEYKHYYAWFQNNDVYYTSNHIKGIELFFYKDKLDGIKLKFNNAQSLMSDLKTAFGDPTFSAIPVNLKNILKYYRIDWDDYPRFPDIHKILLEDDLHPLKVAYNTKIGEIETGNKGYYDPLAQRNLISDAEKLKVLRDLALEHVEERYISEEANYYWNSNLVELQYYSKFLFKMPSLMYIGYNKSFYDGCDYVLNYVDSFPPNTFKSRDLYEFGIKEDEVYLTFFYKPLLTFKRWNDSFESELKRELKQNQDHADSISKRKSIDDL